MFFTILKSYCKNNNSQNIKKQIQNITKEREQIPKNNLVEDVLNKKKRRLAIKTKDVESTEQLNSQRQVKSTDYKRKKNIVFCDETLKKMISSKFGDQQMKANTFNDVSKNVQNNLEINKKDAKKTGFYSNQVLKYRHKARRLDLEPDKYEEHKYAQNMEFKDELKTMTNNMIVQQLKTVKRRMKGEKKQNDRIEQQQQLNDSIKFSVQVCPINRKQQQIDQMEFYYDSEVQGDPFKANYKRNRNILDQIQEDITSFQEQKKRIHEQIFKTRKQVQSPSITNWKYFDQLQNSLLNRPTSKKINQQ